MDRRRLLKGSGLMLLGLPCAAALRILPVGGAEASAGDDSSKETRWGMLINLHKCREECSVCTDACRKENNVAFHGDKRWDIHWIRKVTIRSLEAPEAGEQSVPLLCNQCDEPPCAQVCPVQATFKRDDGVVLIDHHRCIGCRYCVVACPYNARFFNYKENRSWPNKDFPKRSHGVAESCTFCAHLLDEGRLPVCVEGCPSGALIFGNLNDPDSEIARMVAQNPVTRLRDDLGTRPKVYYIGLKTG